MVRSVSYSRRPAAFAPALAVLATLALGACASGGQPPPTPKVVHLPSQPRAVVRMLPDRSLEVVTLVSERGSRAHGVRIVTPQHRDYARLLPLVADLRLGDAQPVQVDAGR